MARAVTCMVCGKIIPVPRGLSIYGLFLCRVCEAGINSISPEDPDYKDYINGLKKVWCFCGA